ncbi:hypothetical protein NDU88_010681 [Pleurodeles waltl]|uniref:Uncharacterized protein n=1 Tax=Pleurodeles waltl TaxID=8319 RepID=A0AAV7QY20_PLEWA|nr:hypothetical protein NDU88_010681 [Pleurodeles waltl]
MSSANILFRQEQKQEEGKLEWMWMKNKGRRRARTQVSQDQAEKKMDSSTQAKEQPRGTGKAEKPAMSLEGCGYTRYVTAYVVNS